MQATFSGSTNSYHNHHHSNSYHNNHHNHHQHQSNNGIGSGGPSLSSVVGFDITEPENFTYIYSMQLLTFMFAICDHLILVLDSLSFDIYLLKLVATALMMVGDSIPKANLIVYLKSANGSPAPLVPSFIPQQKPYNNNISSSHSMKMNTAEDNSSFFNHGYHDLHNYHLHSPTNSNSRIYELLKSTLVAILGPNVNIDIITDEHHLLTTVLKPPSRNLLVTDQQSQPIQYHTERAWFHSVQRFWENSIRKSTLFVDYARYLP